MEVINDRSMPRTAATMRTVVLLLVSICLSVAIGLAMLITALTPASVAAPPATQSAPRDACAVAVVQPGQLITSARCQMTTVSSTCCT